MAHALYGYDGACKNIHGHTYKLSVTIKGIPVDNKKNSKNGMVIDFTDLKALVTKHILSKFDHALVLNKNSPHKNIGKELKQQFEKIIFLDTQPTCENLLLHFIACLKPFFNKKIELVYLRLDETPTSYAEWLSEDIPV
jgi:6-pyruvoyltetrahydropterin/6-carboxytetrahydropterin synthase